LADYLTPRINGVCPAATIIAYATEICGYTIPPKISFERSTRKSGSAHDLSGIIDPFGSERIALRSI